MTQPHAQRILVKGIREGLLISLNDETGAVTYEDLLRELDDDLSAKKEFFRGSRVAFNLGEQVLTQAQLAGLQEFFARQELELWAVLTDAAVTREAARELGLAIRLSGSNTDLDGNVLQAGELRLSGDETAADLPSVETITGSAGLLLKETLRSGRSVFHEGHVVVIGDVNPGAEIIAGGDVVVWGKLRGLVHAGAMGDATAVICALELIPTQLRIADQIAIAPDERRRQPIPEMVAVRNGRIVAEAWPVK